MPQQVTPLVIANLTAKQVEEPRLASLDEDKQFSNDFRELLPFITRLVLRSTVWTNFKVTMPFEPVTLDRYPVGFTHAYLIPEDCVYLYGAEDTFSTKEYEKQLHPEDSSKNIVYTPYKVVEFHFIRYTENYAVYTTELADLIAMKMAERLAPFYLKDEAKITRISRETTKLFSSYGDNDAQETGVQYVDNSGRKSDFITTRGEGTSGFYARATEPYEGE